MELKDLIEEQGKAFHEFKAANDKRLAEIEKTGKAAEDTIAKVETINKDLDRVAEALKELAAKVKRPQILAADGKTVLTQEQVDHKKGFGAYMRKGQENGLRELEEKTMFVGSDPDGGFWVPEDTSGRIVAKIYEISDIRRLASVQNISTDALTGAIDNEQANYGWVGEQQARPATGTPKTGQWRIPVHEMYAMPEATQNLLDDAVVDVEAWLMNKVVFRMAQVEAAAFVNGDGVTKPRGFLTYTTEATGDATRSWGTFEHVATGTSGGFGSDPNGSDKLIDLVHKLKKGYRNNASFLMNKTTLGAARKLKTTNGDYIWLPNNQIEQNGFSTLMGYPVGEAEDMPDIGANTLSIAFGDFREMYQIVDRQGIRTLRDPFTNKPFVRFYTTKRVGGDVLNFEAVKFMKFI